MDRKTLIREYKEHRPEMGVYRVACTVTGRAIVAASKNLPAILNRHRSQFRLGAHPHAELYQDWKTHGQDAFVFEVLETLPSHEDPAYNPVQELAALEDKWLAELGVTPDKMHTIYPGRLR